MSAPENAVGKEASILGKPVRLLDDHRLAASIDIKAEQAAMALGSLQQAISGVIDATALVEVLQYEQRRRAEVPPPRTEQEERFLFETWAKDYDTHMEEGKYTASSTHIAWEGWRARAFVRTRE